MPEHSHSQGHTDKSEKTSSAQTHIHKHKHPPSDSEQGCQLLQKHHWDNSDNKHSSCSQVFLSWETLQWKFRANVPLYEYNNTSESQLGECAALESKRPNYRGSLKFFAHEGRDDESRDTIRPIWMHLKIMTVLMGMHKSHNQNCFQLEICIPLKSELRHISSQLCNFGQACIVTYSRN